MEKGIMKLGVIVLLALETSAGCWHTDASKGRVAQWQRS